MVDGSPRRRKDIKFSGSATDMENNMDGTGRGMADMTMTVPKNNMEMDNMDGTGRGMADMTMTVPDTAMTNTGTKNNMENNGINMEKSMAIATENAMTNMEKKANGIDTEKTEMCTCKEMMDTMGTCMEMMDA